MGVSFIKHIEKKDRIKPFKKADQVVGEVRHLLTVLSWAKWVLTCNTWGKLRGV